MCMYKPLQFFLSMWTMYILYRHDAILYFHKPHLKTPPYWRLLPVNINITLFKITAVYIQVCIFMTSYRRVWYEPGIRTNLSSTARPWTPSCGITPSQPHRSPPSLNSAISRCLPCPRLWPVVMWVSGRVTDNYVYNVVFSCLITVYSLYYIAQQRSSVM